MNHNLSPSKILVNLGFLILGCGWLFSASAFAQINYANFSNNVDNLNFVNDSGVQGSDLRLIRTVNGGRAAVWSKTAQPMRNGFVTMFSFRISNPDHLPCDPSPCDPNNLQGGADGFAFVIHSYGDGIIGNGGGQIGYASGNPGQPLGIPYSLAIEFDTYFNDTLHDPDDNHISIHTAGNWYNDADEVAASIARADSAALGFNMKDGQIHNVRIEYDGAIMKVFVTSGDDWNFTTPIITVPVNFNEILWSEQPNPTVGFTAGSAFESENHDILNWSFSPTYTEDDISYDGDAPDADTVGPNSLIQLDGDTGPNAISMPEYHPGADVNDFNVNAKVDMAVLPDRKTELWAKYYFPSNIEAAGTRPLVMLLHGNHGTCGYIETATGARFDNDNDYTTQGRCNDKNGKTYVVAPSHRGYEYLAQKLASWGYVVASINSNLGITSGNSYPMQTNFPEYKSDPYLIRARGRLVLRHLQRLSEWNAGVTQFINQPPALDIAKNNFTGWLGMKITIGAQPINLRALGRMYRNGNSQNHTVKVVRASDNVQIASVTGLSMTKWDEGQFKYKDLAAPVTLAANTSYYIVSNETTAGDYWYDSNTTVSVNNVATVDGKVSSPNGTTTWDTSGGIVNKAYGTVDFIYEPVSDTPFVSSTANGTERNNFTGSVGMKMTVGSQPVKVVSLGRMSLPGNSQTHALKIIKVSDNATVANVNVAMSGSTTGQFKYATLTAPVTLAANTSYYVVSQETDTGDKWYDSNTTVITTNVAAVNNAIQSADGTTWSNPGGGLKPFGPVSFIYQTSLSTTPAELGVNLKGKIDFGNVGLMGHSRGGEGVRAAYNLYRDTSSTYGNPWTDTTSTRRIRAAMTIKGIFEIAPTDRFLESNNPFDPAAPYVNAEKTAWTVLLPACDGDIFYLGGVQPLDRMLDPANTIANSESPAKLKASYLVYGANHNFYNTEWQYSDSIDCVGTDNPKLFNQTSVNTGATGAGKIRQTGLSSLLAFFRGNVGASANASFNKNFNPRFKLPSSLSAVTKIQRGFTASPSSTQTISFNSLRPGVSGDICSTSIICNGMPLPVAANGIKVQVNSNSYPGSDVINHDLNFTAAGVTWLTASPTNYLQANYSTAAYVDASSYQTLDFRVSRRRSDDPNTPLLINPDNENVTTNFIMDPEIKTENNAILRWSQNHHEKTLSCSFQSSIGSGTVEGRKTTNATCRRASGSPEPASQLARCGHGQSGSAL